MYNYLAINISPQGDFPLGTSFQTPTRGDRHTQYHHLQVQWCGLRSRAHDMLKYAVTKTAAHPGRLEAEYRYTYHRHMQPMGLLVLYMYMVLQFSNSFHKCCSNELQFKILKILLVQIILYLHYISFAAWCFDLQYVTYLIVHTRILYLEYYTCQ